MKLERLIKRISRLEAAVNPEPEEIVCIILPCKVPIGDGVDEPEETSYRYGNKVIKVCFKVPEEEGESHEANANSQTP
ncbi:MAG: hypothetical protein ACPL5F_14730 [Moorellaceae bacterium]